MGGEIEVAGVGAAMGERAAGVAQVQIGGRSVDVPVVVVNGRRTGPRVAITAGIHGAEYVGIEAARRLGMTLDPEELTGSVVVVPIANTTAFFRRSIYTSGLDENNLNRSFPGRPDSAPAEQLAHWLFTTIIEPSDAYIDLHGGDMIEALVPFVIYLGSDDETEERSRAMAEATGIPRLIRSLTPGSTYAAAARAGIPAILAEIGGQGVWSDELVEEHVAGARRVLAHLGLLSNEPAARGESRQYDTFAWLRSKHDGLFHPSVAVGESVREGQEVGKVVDYFGAPLQLVTAPVSGEVVFLVTSLAMTAGDPLMAVGA